MRIGNKAALSKKIIVSMRTVLLVTVSAFPIIPHISFAADPATMAMPPMAQGAAPAAMSGAPPLQAPDPADPAMAGAPKADMTKNVSTLEDKATDNAKNILKSLDGTDTLTIEDLNRARQTIARIDALIDVEKHLAELDKLRDARTGGSMAGAIPASALNPGGKFMNAGMNMIPPQPITSAPPPITMGMPAMSHSSISGTEVSRIMGTDGKYSAVLKLSDGDARTVRIGDTVNGAMVRSISSSSVTLEEKGGESKVLHVKNVDMVYSEAR